MKEGKKNQNNIIIAKKKESFIVIMVYAQRKTGITKTMLYIFYEIK